MTATKSSRPAVFGYIDASEIKSAPPGAQLVWTRIVSEGLLATLPVLVAAADAGHRRRARALVLPCRAVAVVGPEVFFLGRPDVAAAPFGTGTGPLGSGLTLLVTVGHFILQLVGVG